MNKKSSLVLLLLVVLIPAILVHKLLQQPPRTTELINKQTNPTISTQQQAFINKILPAVRKANQKIRQQRQEVINIYQNWLISKQLNDHQQQKLLTIASKYKLNNSKFDSQTDWKTLLKRVDVIPASLVLAQAIMESGWGHSRLSKLTDNYFGIRCYQKNCGAVPTNRPINNYFEIKKFSNVEAAVAELIHNYNTIAAYLPLREARAKLRQQTKPITSKTLLTTLTNYSALRNEYGDRIQAIIADFNLSQYNLSYSNYQ